MANSRGASISSVLASRSARQKGSRVASVAEHHASRPTFTAVDDDAEQLGFFAIELDCPLVVVHEQTHPAAKLAPKARLRRWN